MSADPTPHAKRHTGAAWRRVPKRSRRFGTGTVRPRLAGVLPGSAALLAVTLLLGLGAPSVHAEPAALARVDALFVIDNSGSMRTNDPGFVTRRLMTDFAGGLARGSRLGVVLFDEEARLVEPLSRSVGPDVGDRWADVMSRIDYSGQRTNSPAGIERALYEFKVNGRPGVEKLIVFITDGLVDTGDPRRDVEKKRWLTEDLADQSRREGVRIFGIALTEAADVELIQALALRTDGEYFRVVQVEDIGPLLARIGDEVAMGADARRDAERPGAAAVPPPPVSSAPSTRTRGAVLLSLGVLVAVVALLVPGLQRRRRRRAPRVAPPPPMRVDVPAAALRSSRTTDRLPLAHLVDVSKVSSRGLLPIPIDKRRISIGRDASNDVTIKRETISSFHATIDYKDGYFYVEDHRSTNGTALNGKSLVENEPMQLKSGDLIEFSIFEFQFMIPEHEPRGRTLVLDGTSLPAGERAGTVLPGQASPDDARDEITNYPDAFEGCLRVHLEKVEGLGSAHADFVRRAFPDDFVGVLCDRAAELIERCGDSDEGQQLDLNRSGVHYALCVLPEEMENAGEWFGRVHGGYARFLAGLLDAWATAERTCSTICVITFGMVEAAWISVTVLPAQRDAEGADIEIMSFEFLSEEERARAVSLDIADVGRGL